MMLNKFENYELQQQQQQPQQRCSEVIVTTPPPQSVGCAADYASASAAAVSKAERESIHSGQFMVSHFEAEEAQDDLEEYDEVKMLDPEDPDLSKHDDPANPCTEVQLYVPLKVTQAQVGQDGAMPGIVTSHLEIETSLTKLFKCMNLAYSQKLTSPKWNHFKGVRLRWKDKIRLNNVIWRCWHMQFILRRKTPVCQFASPLDVDIHSNPQAVVLEGKYWKRQTTVIKAEYRKWRRNYKSKATGCLIYDTKSELDFLEWSPLNDTNLMLPEYWTSDTLFSSINGPFPFPDPREIARGAGIADFMQPGLGSLQPNIDDIDLTIDELFQPQRLPPVPEEGTDEMLKNVDFGFSAIMGGDHMGSNPIIDVSTNAVNQLQSNDDANMLDLNAPLNSMQYSEVEQQYTSRDGSSSSFINAQSPSRTLDPTDTMMTDERTSVLLAEAPTNATRTQTKHFAAANENMGSRQSNNEYSNKSVMKGRISKNFQRPFRREPHNYDKAQPTMHQTTIYQQMLAEHQKSQQSLQPHLQPTMSTTMLQHQAMAYQQQQQQQHLQYPSNQYQTVSHLLGDNNASNTYSGYGRDLTTALGGTARTNNNMVNVTSTDTKSKTYNIVQQASNVPTTQMNSTTTATQNILLNVKTEPDVLSMYNITSSNEGYGSCSGISSNNSSNNLNSYKPYPSFKKSASTGTYINMRVSPNTYIQDQTTTSSHLHAQSLPLSLGNQVTTLPNVLQLQVHAQSQLSPTSSQQQHHQQQQQQQQQSLLTAQQQIQQHQQSTTALLPKEMFRSNSLPLNVTLQKLDMRSSHDNFAVPKYHAKSNKPRSRSNSVHQHILGSNSSGSNNSNNGSTGSIMVTSQLQAATSDPMLNNSTLAQLLTTNSRKTSLGKQQSSSTSAISTMIMPIGSVPMTAAAAVTVPSNKIQNVNVSATKFFMSPAQCSPTSSPLMGTLATGATVTPSETLQRQPIQIQQQPQKSPKKSASLPTPTATPILHSPPSKMLSYPLTAGTQTTTCANTISLSPDSFHDQDSPLSPTHSLKFPRDSQRRAGHIHAEQKRRYNIKNGFDVLHSLIPQLQQNPNAKLSKAAMLQKGADHIKHLRSERNQLNDRMEALRKERDALNNSLTHLHSILPANGAPVTRQGTEHVRQLYEQYVRHHTLENWKFWILGLILEPLLSSYTASVSSASMEELRRTAFLWVDQHCSLVDLRPAVSNKLKYLSMKTDILSDPPSTLQEEVAKAVHNTTGQHPNLHGT